MSNWSSFDADKGITDAWRAFLNESSVEDAPDDPYARPADWDDPPRTPPIDPPEPEPVPDRAFGLTSDQPDSLTTILKGLVQGEGEQKKRLLTNPQVDAIVSKFAEIADDEDVVLEAVALKGAQSEQDRVFGPESTREIAQLIDTLRLDDVKRKEVLKAINYWARVNTVKFSPIPAATPAAPPTATPERPLPVSTGPTPDDISPEEMRAALVSPEEEEVTGRLERPQRASRTRTAKPEKETEPESRWAPEAAQSLLDAVSVEEFMKAYEKAVDVHQATRWGHEARLLRRDQPDLGRLVHIVQNAAPDAPLEDILALMYDEKFLDFGSPDTLVHLVDLVDDEEAEDDVADTEKGETDDDCTDLMGGLDAETLEMLEAETSIRGEVRDLSRSIALLADATAVASLAVGALPVSGVAASIGTFFDSTALAMSVLLLQPKQIMIDLISFIPGLGGASSKAARKAIAKGGKEAAQAGAKGAAKETGEQALKKGMKQVGEKAGKESVENLMKKMLKDKFPAMADETAASVAKALAVAGKRRTQKKLEALENELKNDSALVKGADESDEEYAKRIKEATKRIISKQEEQLKRDLERCVRRTQPEMTRTIGGALDTLQNLIGFLDKGIDWAIGKFSDQFTDDDEEKVQKESLLNEGEIYRWQQLAGINKRVL